MSKTRTWLMLLVALLLPLKGTMAAAGMFCHMGSTTPQAAIGQQHHEHHVDASHAHAGHADTQSGSGAPEPDPGSAASPTCTICSAVCSAPPLPATGPSPLSLPATASERFPALVPPHVTALSGGLERPPRTL
jgi:hypothetical protein